MEKYIDLAKEWLMTKGLDFCINLVAFIIILIVAKIVIGIIKSTLNKALQKSEKVSQMLRHFFVDITGKVLWVIALMIGLQRLGLDIGPLVAGLGVTGFIFGFAFKDSLGNLASGIMILLNQPFKIGDFVEISGTMGSVKSMNLMATELATPDNKKITIPNSSVWGNTITNFSANDTRRVDMIFGIGYGDDIQKAKDIITEVLKNNDKVLPEPEPLIEVKSLSDSSVDFTVRPWAKSSDYWKLYYEVTRKVKEEFDKNNVSIPFPQMDVHVSKE